MFQPDSDLPLYRQLPADPAAPPGSAWELFGADDSLDTLNLLTPERVREAAALVRTGRTFPLQLPLDLPHRRPGAGRANPAHHIIQSSDLARDDRLDAFYPQGSSQWDSFAHIRHLLHGSYNGFGADDRPGDVDPRLGIAHWAERGIVGRGVLLDVQRFLLSQGRPLDARSNDVIDVATLRATAEAQRVELKTGDVLLFRTGWTERYLAEPRAVREEMIDPFVAPGLEPSEAMVEYLWDWHIAAVASDNLGVECFPAPEPSRALFLHMNLLALLGTPIGEMWYLEELAEACAEDGVYEFMLVSVPLYLPKGVGSPPQAIAIK